MIKLLLMLLLKIDKLKQTDIQKLKREYPDGIFISNLKNKGIDKLEKKIASYLFGE